MSRYVFTNADGIVVQVISGSLDAGQQAQFLNDYAALFGAVAIIEVLDDTTVWIGGTYADGKFFPPVQPDIVEGTATIIEEPQPEPLPEPTEPEI
jgi:hypothetical protein